MALRPSRPPSAATILLLSTGTLLLTLIAIFFLAACAGRVGSDAELASPHPSKRVTGSVASTPSGLALAWDTERYDSIREDDDSAAPDDDALSILSIDVDTAPSNLRILLRDSEYEGEGIFDLAPLPARGALGVDPRGERAGFARLVTLARDLDS